MNEKEYIEQYILDPRVRHRQ